MQRALTNLLPSWVCILLAVIILCTAVSIAFILIRKYFPGLLCKDSSFMPAVIVVSTSNYAFLLGFVIVVLWQAYNNAKLVTMEEASGLAMIVWDSDSLPEPTRSEAVAYVGKYIGLVIHQEWPAMSEGQFTPEAFLALQQLLKTMQNYSPKTDSEGIFYDQIIHHINVVIEKRRERLRSIDTILTWPLRFILIFGILLIGFLLSLIHSNNSRVQLLAIVITCGIMAFNMGIAWTLDYPFSGDLSVDYKPFIEGILGQFQK